MSPGPLRSFSFKDISKPLFSGVYVFVLVLLHDFPTQFFSMFGCLQPVYFQSSCSSFFLSVISAAMLYPVLLCATLLLLTPLEITEARALHPSPDAVQVQGEGGKGLRGGGRIEKSGLKRI